jgi:hypothetical protein
MMGCSQKQDANKKQIEEAITPPFFSTCVTSTPIRQLMRLIIFVVSVWFKASEKSFEASLKD